MTTWACDRQGLLLVEPLGPGPQSEAYTIDYVCPGDRMNDDGDKNRP